MNVDQKRAAIILAIVLALTIVAFGRMQTTAWAAGTTYYVDCSAGSNGDGSQESPWNNTSTISNTTFVPGDSLRFKRGTTCHGQLWPKGSGAEGSPITIGSFGLGALPIIDGGSNQSSLKLYNQEYWEFQEIEVVGGTTFGIFVNGDGSQMLHHFRITDVIVRDVYDGDMSVKTTGLIVFGYDWTQHFEDVVIDGVTAYNTNMWAGIVITGKDWGRADEIRDQLAALGWRIFRIHDRSQQPGLRNWPRTC